MFTDISTDGWTHVGMRDGPVELKTVTPCHIKKLFITDNIPRLRKCKDIIKTC